MIYCTTCGAPQEAGIQFCTGCGKQLDASLATAGPAWPQDGWATGPTGNRGRRWIVLAGLVLLLGGGAGVATWVALAHDADPSPSVAQPPAPAPPLNPGPAPGDPPPSGPVSSGTISASALCVSSTSNDAGGNRITYGPEQAVDGLPDTAWRCDGDGVGQQLEISFPELVTLAGIGMVPGYAKTDPYDGTDRYAQNRRISAVRYTFDDGSEVTQNLDTDASHRSPQLIALPGVSTGHVTITILSSVSGDRIGEQQPSDRVVISEVIFSTS